MSTARPRAASLRVTIHIGGQTFEEDLGAQLSVQNNPEALSQAMAEHAGRVAWWLTLEVQARDAVEASRDALAYFESQAINEMLDAEPTMNPATAKRRIRASAAYRQRTDALREARTALRTIQVGTRTHGHRKSMLIALASTARAEMEGRLSLSARMDAAREQWRQHYKKGSK
jgi:hypothetical protein